MPERKKAEKDGESPGILGGVFHEELRGGLAHRLA